MRILIKTACIVCLSQSLHAAEAQRVILDETGVKNLGLETVVVQPRDFRTTVFAVGGVEERPSNLHSVSSRISGRVMEVKVSPGDAVAAGETVAIIESRQPGSPPPLIELKALRAGIVTDSHIVQGQPVEPDANLFELSERGSMWAIAQIPEASAVGIGPGTRARIVFPAIGGEAMEADLKSIGVRADRVAGTLEGIFEIPNAAGKFLPGMRAEFSLIVKQRPNVLAIPVEALQGEASARVVFVRDADVPNSFLRTPVVMGEKDDGWVEVREGLSAGDEVVTRGAYSLGFVGGGSGISLKEALDAAHGHEHAADGSELPEGGAGDGHHDDHECHECNEHHDEHEVHEVGAPGWLVYYAIGSTLGLMVLGQQLWNQRRDFRNSKSA